MYTKATAVELQFSPDRLNDGAGDPFWIDLNHNEAVELHQALQRYLDTSSSERPAPFVVSPDNKYYFFNPETRKPLLNSEGHLRALEA